MKIYNLHQFLGEKGKKPTKIDIPKKLGDVFLWKLKEEDLSRNMLATNYLRLKPDRFENENLLVKERGVRTDVEETTGNFWMSSERFKEFSEKENLGLEFFPVLVENERKYLTSWRKLPTFGDKDLDLEKTKFRKSGLPEREHTMYFRSDVIEYYNWKIFADFSLIYIYITGELKEKIEKEKFKFTLWERNCTQIKFNKEKVEKHLIKSKKEEKIFLNKGRKNYLQKTDEALEKILIEDGETELLEKFRKEMKGIWKRDFDRYEKGEMGPLEKVKSW